MRRFYLIRKIDVSGVSGCGIVAEGVEWSDGSATVHWLGDSGSYDSTANLGFAGRAGFIRGIDAVEERHSHQGATHVLYVDSENESSDHKRLYIPPEIFGKDFIVNQGVIYALTKHDFEAKSQTE